MEWKQIRELSDKYWKAQTTVDEERELRKNTISSNDPLDPQEVEYFKTLEEFSTVSLDNSFDDRFFAQIESKKRVTKFYTQKWFQLAASVLLMIGVSGGIHSYKERQLARQQEARQAFEIAKSALFMVSDKMNLGSQYTLDGLSKFEETQQKIKTQNYKN